MSQTTPAAASPLTVVLVHGAFADASGWTDDCEQLQAAGVQVIAPANPLRGISIDSAYIASVLAQIPGPVLAVGHSYGGAVISNAATGADNVVGPRLRRRLRARGGRATDRRRRHLEGQRPERCAGPAAVSDRTGHETAVEFDINPTSFHDVFASDLPAQQAGDDGRHPATRRRIGVLRTVRSARLEDPALLGRRRNRRQGGRRRRHPFDGTNGPAPRSPKPKAHT